MTVTEGTQATEVGGGLTPVATRDPNAGHSADAERFIREKVAAGFGTPFRGQIWENCKRFKLVGKAYEAMPREQDGHFWIESARHLSGPLRALKDPAVRAVIVIGATQVMKSVAGDIWVPFIMEHGPRNMLVLFEADDKAVAYCKTRLMDTIKEHPVLSRLIAEVKVENRHEVTTTYIKLPGMVLSVGGLNDSNVSTFSWPLIWVSEAWQHRSDGLLKKAIKRADRFPLDCKIFIESQAGFAEEDLHTEVKKAHVVHCTWACPMCGGRQDWETPNEYGRLRPDDFVARKPFSVIEWEGRTSASQRGEALTPSPSPVGRERVADRPGEGSAPVASGGSVDSVTAPAQFDFEPALWTAPKPGSYSGMKFGPYERTSPDGKVIPLTIEERAREAYWECYHCGSAIRDTRATRQRIMDSYEQDYRIKKVEGRLQNSIRERVLEILKRYNCDAELEPVMEWMRN